MSVPPEDPRDAEQPRTGRLRPTGPGAVTAWACVGLVAGWLLRPAAERLQGTAPVVVWVQPLALVVLAAVLGVTAWLTWRHLQVRRAYLDPRQAVNRLVLARACALTGALVAGGYAGYAVAWLGVDTELGQQRLLRSAVGALGGGLVVVAALLLERACRVPPGDSEA